MLFRNRSARSKLEFHRPRVATLDLNIPFMPEGTVWLPVNAWEAADIDYFAATAGPLQTQTLRAPRGSIPSRRRNEPQVPNLAGRWVLKLAGEQLTGAGQNLHPIIPENYLGWAETHAFYSTFMHAELVIFLTSADAGDRRLLDAMQDSLLQLVAAHCVMLRSSGTLRVIAATSHTAGLVDHVLKENEATTLQEVFELGRFAGDPRMSSCPRKITFDIAPDAWCSTEAGKTLAKSLSWLAKRVERESRLRRR